MVNLMPVNLKAYKWLVFAGVWVILAASTACNRTHHTTIAVIPKATSNIFWESVHAGAAKAASENQVRMIWDGPPLETDIAGEMKIVETMINRHIDAIVVAPNDRSALRIVVERAAAAKIPVVVYDSAVDSDLYSTFVATDNYLGGKLGADRMGKLLNGKGKIVLVKTSPGGASTMAREDGFRDELHAKFPGIAILDERFGMSSVALSLTAAENMLTAHPDIDGIFASNETGSEGAAQALKGRGIHAKLVGFDSSPLLIDMLKSGWIDSLVVQHPFQMGETAVDEAIKAIRGEKTPKKIFLPPRLVDSDNINAPDVQAQLFPDLRKYLGS
jgi:ribose transport system substrate-binding protein